jgi:hypothetical protein
MIMIQMRIESMKNKIGEKNTGQNSMKIKT